jgi:hypothetical protein
MRATEKETERFLFLGLKMPPGPARPELFPQEEQFVA